MKIKFEEMSFLTHVNPTVKIFKSENFPLITSFLNSVFKEGERNELPDNEMETKLADYIYDLKQSGEGEYLSDKAKTYLEKWTNDGFLRKYYPGESDIPVYQLTPAAEKALQWLNDLEKREFIGTESRLMKIFDLLKEIVYKSTEDPKRRLEELYRRKEELEDEIQKVKFGEFQMLDDTQIKERFFELNDTARKLLSDFREIEYNFRSLDRQVREKQLNQELTKGKMLEDIFDFHELLWNTDQGKSFKAFWEFLMSPEKQDELDELTEKVLTIHVVESISDENKLERLKVDLIDAGDKVNKTTHGLIEQLRRYLDSNMRLENKRIIEIVKEIKSIALELKNNPPKDKDFFMLEDKPDIQMIMERPLFSPPKVSSITEFLLTEGMSDADMESLYSQHFVDIAELKNNIGSMLVSWTQISLRNIIEKYPVEKGLSEIMAYVEIASKDEKAVINEENSEEIVIFNKEKNKSYKINLPEIIFIK